MKTHIRPVIAGISMHMVNVADPGMTLGGPAIYAGFGLRIAGYCPSILSAIGNNMSPEDFQILDAIDQNQRRFIAILPKPMLVWRGKQVLGVSDGGVFSDDPCAWRTHIVPIEAVKQQPLILANGDPSWHCDLLSLVNPSSIYLDIHFDWMDRRENELSECMRRADVITMTEREFGALTYRMKQSLKSTDKPK